MFQGGFGEKHHVLAEITKRVLEPADVFQGPSSNEKTAAGGGWRIAQGMADREEAGRPNQRAGCHPVV